MRRALGLAAGLLSFGDRRVDALFTDDSLIASLAAEYRKSPFPTDVLAFAYDDEKDLAGEIVISLDTARRQALERREPLAHELILLGIHGLLHIKGQGDETRRDWCMMRIKEFEMLVKVL